MSATDLIMNYAMGGGKAYSGVETHATANQRRDGRLEYLRAQKLFDTTQDQVLSRWNNDHLPHPRLLR